MEFYNSVIVAGVAHTGRLAVLACLLIGLTASSGNAQVNQPGSGFYDLGDSHTPDPSSLLRFLSKYQSNPIDRTPLFSQLEKAGRDIFSSLPPEQKATAQQFAEQLIRNEGFESPKVQSLMNQMGIDPSLQQSLSQQFDPDSLNRNQGNVDKLKRMMERGKFNEALAEAEWLQQSELMKAWRSNDATAPDNLGSQIGNTDSFDRAGKEKPDFKKLNEINEAFGGSSNPKESSSSNRNSKTLPRSDKDNDRSVVGSGFDPKDLASSPKRNEQSKPNRRPSNTRTPTSKPGGKSLDELLDETNRLLAENESNRNQRANSDARENASSSSSNGRTSQNNSMNKGNASAKPSRKPNRKPNRELTDEDFAKDFYNIASDVLPKVKPSERSGKSKPMDIDLEKLQELKKLITETTAQPGEDSIGDWSKRFSSLIDRPERKESEENLGAQFDRIMLSAAKKSVETLNNDEGQFSDTFKKVIRSAVKNAKTKVDSLKGKKQDRSSSDDRGSKRDRFNDNPFVEKDTHKSLVENMNSILGSDDIDRSSSAADQANSSSNDSSGSSSSSSSTPSIPDIGSVDLGSLINVQTLTVFALLMALVAAGVALFYKMNPDLTEEQIRQQQLNKKLRSTLREPDDLVDAVDLYLLANHGSEAAWWDATKARESVVESKPSLKDRVTSLFQFYIQSRYSPEASSVDEREREDAKSTLRALVRSPDSQTSVATVESGSAVPTDSSESDRGHNDGTVV